MLLVSGGLVLWVLRGSVLVEDVGGRNELVGDVIQFIILEALGARGPGGFVGVVGGIRKGVVVVGMIWLGHLDRVFLCKRRSAGCSLQAPMLGRCLIQADRQGQPHEAIQLAGKGISREAAQRCSCARKDGGSVILYTLWWKVERVEEGTAAVCPKTARVMRRERLVLTLHAFNGRNNKNVIVGAAASWLIYVCTVLRQTLSYHMNANPTLCHPESWLPSPQIDNRQLSPVRQIHPPHSSLGTSYCFSPRLPILDEACPPPPLPNVVIHTFIFPPR